MNITFLIGNGFDLNLGLKTSYANFYPFFCEKAKQENMIKKWISKSPENWADLEAALGHNTTKLSPKNIKDFLNDKGDMEELLLEYLSEQEMKLSDINDEITTEFIRSLREFDKLLPTEQRKAIQQIKTHHREQEFKYRFISFNYTSSLNNIVKKSKINNPINTHKASDGADRKETISDVFNVHGTISEGMILGVNDAAQIKNVELQNNSVLVKGMVKPRLNDSLAEERNVIAANIIKDSAIIVIFGMSLGDTDKDWWKRIVNWLNDDKHRLIIYSHVDNVEVIHKVSTKRVLAQDAILDRFFSRGRSGQSKQLLDVYKGRTFVVFSNDIFRFGREGTDSKVQDEKCFPGKRKK